METFIILVSVPVLFIRNPHRTSRIYCELYSKTSFKRSRAETCFFSKSVPVMYKSIYSHLHHEQFNIPITFPSVTKQNIFFNSLLFSGIYKGSLHCTTRVHRTILYQITFLCVQSVHTLVSISTSGTGTYIKYATP